MTVIGAEQAFASGRYRDLIELYEQVPQNLTKSELAWVGRAYLCQKNYNAARYVLASSLDELGWVYEWQREAFHSATCFDTGPFDQSCLPTILKTELDQFTTIIKSAFRGEQTEIKIGKTFSPATLAHYYLKGKCQLVYPRDMADSALEQIETLGISSGFLKASRGGHSTLSDLKRSLLSNYKFAQDATITPHMVDLIGSVMLGGKPTLCPFSGTLGLSTVSIDANTYILSVKNNLCVTVCERTAEAYSDHAWWILDQDLIIETAYGKEVYRILAESLVRIVSHVDLYIEHFNFLGKRKIMISDAVVGHIGHYIWNVISGWTNLFKYVSPSQIDIITTEKCGQLIGGVKTLYCKEYGEISTSIEIEGPEKRQDIMLTQKALCIMMFDCYVTQDLADRVLGWAFKTASLKSIKGIQEYCNGKKPLISITLRLENRSWIEQASGLVYIIKNIAKHYPQAGFVIDGLNADLPGGDTHDFMSIDKEMEVACSIIEQCVGVSIYNSIGCDRAESIILCNEVDVSLAPVGAGMAKTRWLANKPTIAYSNETCMAPNSYDGRLYERFRDHPAPIIYIDRKYVKDVETERHGQRFRANFSMSPERLAAPVMHMIGTLQSSNITSLEKIKVQRIDEVWCAIGKLAGEATPLQLNGQQLENFQDGWEPLYLVVGIDNIKFLELQHISGARATWYLDAFTLNRVAGGANELKMGIRAGLIKEIQAKANLITEDCGICDSTRRELLSLAGLM